MTVTLFICFSLGAHSRTEVGFRFTEEDNKTYLNVHLTSSTLFDILYDLYPELESRESLNLSQYTIEYEDYFNQHILLELNDENHTLKYVDSNLIIHDATIKFLIHDLDEEIEKFKVSIGGFDFYKKPSFTILFTTPTITQTCFLSKNENTCSGVSLVIEQSGGDSNWFYWVVTIVACLLITTWFSRRKVSSY